MIKTFKLYSVIWAICFAMFNIIAFVSPISINVLSGSFWIGYLFIVIAFAGQLYCSYIAFKDENLQNTFYNISLVLVSYIALAAMLIAGSLCMIIPLFPISLSIILCVLIAGISSSIILITCFVINVVSSTDTEIETKTFVVKALAADAEHLLSTAQSFELKKECEKVFEALRYSDPMSNAALSEINEQIQTQFSSFESAVNSSDLELTISNGSELLTLIDKRNKQCSFFK